MNEEAMMSEVEEQEAVEQFDEGITDAEFDALWDSEDDDNSFIEPEETEADQPEGSEGAEAEQPESEQPEAVDADQYLELKHFDEVRKVTKAEAKELAQKGMDYDRIRGKLSDAEANLQRLQRYEGFLNEMKGDFDSIEDLMADSRARLLADKENISYEEAVGRIQVNIQQEQMKQQMQQQLSPEAISEAMRKQSLQQFLQTYPDVKPKDIPQEVWDDMNITNNLVASYAKYEAKKIASENEILKQNAKNKSRSTGSMKSSGKTYADDYDRMWYEDDD